MLTLFVKDLVNNDIFELPLYRAAIIQRLNKGSSATLDFDYYEIEKIGSAHGVSAAFILSGGKREISIVKDNTVIYLGLISEMALAKNNSGKLLITIGSVDYLQILSKRRTAALDTHSGVDSSDIAWDLINDSQGSDSPYSDFGITRGADPTTINRDRTFRFANVYDEIIGMSNEKVKDGFDCDINTSKQFNVYYPTKGSQRANIVLDDRNINSWKYKKPLVTSLTNQVYVLGQGSNDDRLYRKRTSLTTYRDAFGLLEDVINHPDASQNATLDERGDKYLELNQAPTIEYEFSHPDDEPDITTYDVGDSLRVKLAEAGLADVYLRVYQRQLDIDKNSYIKSTLTMR